MLQETYQLDPSDFLSGSIQFQNGKNFKGCPLKCDDLKDLAKLAFDMQWYDNTISFLKAVEKVKKLSGKMRRVW